jgi:hypothetical protein
MTSFKIFEASLRPLGLAALLCGGSLVFGCSSDAEPEAQAEMTRGEFCEKWAAAACTPEVVSVCQASSESACKASQIDACLENLPNEFVDRGVDECIAAIEKAYEDADLSETELDIVVRYGAPCGEIFIANDKGDACSNDSDCDSTLVCVFKDKEDGTCQTPVTVEPGLSCSNSDETCTEGFYCDGENCIAALDEDDACTNDVQCGADLYCDEMCIQKTDVGEDCDNDSQCASGICYASEADSTCVDRLRLSPAEPICETLK